MFAVVFFLNVNVDKVNDFRQQYDSHWQIIFPHITIVLPLLGISEKQLIEHVEVIAKNVKSFPIHLTGLTKTFDDCLFLMVKEGNEKILNVYNKLYSGILLRYKQTSVPFIPHITLGCFRTDTNKFDENLYSKAYAEAQNLNFDIHCDFSSLSIIKGDGMNPAEIITTIHFP